LSETAREAQPAGTSLLLLAVLMVTGATIFTGVLMLGPLLLDLAAEFHTSVAVVGQLVTAGGLVWAGLAPVVGALSDRYGRKPLLLLGLVTFAFFGILSSFARDLPTLFAGRMLMSIGGALVATNLQASVADYFPSAQRGRALGWVIAGFSLAPVVGVPAVAFLAEIGGWRWSFRLLAVWVLLVGAVLHQVLPGSRPQGGGSYGTTFATLFSNRSVAGLMLSNVFERIAFGAVTTYLAAFLMRSYGLSVGQVAPVISLVAAGSLVGNLLGGRIAGWMNPVTVFVVAQGLSAIALPPLMSFAPALWLSGLLAAGFGVLNAFSRPSYMWMVTQVGVRIRGAMMGLNVMSNQLGLVLGAALGGLMIGVAGYSELGLLACGTALLGALSCRLLVRPESLAKVGAEAAK
jgi:predicted MFS family arabinose efflux permease